MGNTKQNNSRTNNNKHMYVKNINMEWPETHNIWENIMGLQLVLRQGVFHMSGSEA